MRSYFITLEGIEGAGKSTIAKHLVELLHSKKIDFILTREPGGTQISEKIRDVILSHYIEPMHADTELLLYFAGRAQHLNQIIIPALRSGKWVICDRFTDATYAYQGGGRGLDYTRISGLENWVQGSLRPDYTLLFDVDIKCGLGRVKQNRTPDRIEVEKESFFTRVKNCYLERAHSEPNRFYIIDANQELSGVIKQADNILNKIIHNTQKRV